MVNEMKKTTIKNMIFSLLLLLVLVGLSNVYRNYQKPLTCKTYSRVVAILDINPDMTTVKMMCGKIIGVPDKKVKVGDSICVQWERK
jgi:hypothetical protein